MKGLEDVPTFKESGYDVEVANWRGFLGSVGMPEANYKEWVERFTKLSESKEWQAVLAKQGWDGYFLAGDAFGAFIQSESTRINKKIERASCRERVGQYG